MYNLIIDTIIYIKNIICLLYNNILLYSINNNGTGVSSIYLGNKYYNYKDEIGNILLIKKILISFFLLIEISLIFIQKFGHEYLDIINLNLYIFNNNKILLEKFMYNYGLYNQQIKNISLDVLLNIININLKNFNLLNSENEIFNEYIKKVQKGQELYNKFLNLQKIARNEIPYNKSLKYLNILTSEDSVFNEVFFKAIKNAQKFLKIIFMSKNIDSNITLLNYGHIYDININKYNYNMNFNKNNYNLKNINYNSSLYNNLNNKQEKGLNLPYYGKLQEEMFQFIYKKKQFGVGDQEDQDHLLYGKELYPDNKRIFKNYHESMHLYDDQRNGKKFTFRKKPVKPSIFKKAFGGYTNGGLGHQDAYYIHGEKGAYYQALGIPSGSEGKFTSFAEAVLRNVRYQARTGKLRFFLFPEIKYIVHPRRYKFKVRIPFIYLDPGENKHPLEGVMGGNKIGRLRPPIHTDYFGKAKRSLGIRFLFSNDLSTKIDSFRTYGSVRYIYPKQRRNMLEAEQLREFGIFFKKKEKYLEKIAVKKKIYNKIRFKYGKKMEELLKSGRIYINIKDFKKYGSLYKKVFSKPYEGSFYFGRYKTNFSVLKEKKPIMYSKYTFICFNPTYKVHPLEKNLYSKKLLKYLDKKILKIGLNLISKSKKLFQQSNIPLRGLLIKKYILRSYFHGEKNFFYHQMFSQKRILSKISYLNIEHNKNNNILLNYINKSFYIKYLKIPTEEMFKRRYHDEGYGRTYDSNYVTKSSGKLRMISGFKPVTKLKKLYILDNNLIKGTVYKQRFITVKFYNNSYYDVAVPTRFFYITKIPMYKKILIKKQYIQNIFDLYKNEEQLILNFFYYNNIFYTIKKINYNIKNIFYIIYKFLNNLLFFYKNFLFKFISVIIEQLWHYIIKTLKRDYFIKNFDSYLIKKYNVSIFKLDDYFKKDDYFKDIIIYLEKKIKKIINIILNNYKVFFLLLIYVIVAIFLILIIKSILPKNIIYSIKIKDQINFFKSLEEKISINNIFLNKGDEFIYEWDLTKKKNNIKKKEKKERF